MRCLQGSGHRARLPLLCPAVGRGVIRTRWKQMPMETSSVGGGGPCTYHHHHASQNAQLCVTGPKPVWNKHYLGKKHNYPLLISPLWMLLVLCYDIKTITFQSEFGFHHQAFCAQRKYQCLVFSIPTTHWLPFLLHSCCHLALHFCDVQLVHSPALSPSCSLPFPNTLCYSGPLFLSEEYMFSGWNGASSSENVQGL